MFRLVETCPWTVVWLVSDVYKTLFFHLLLSYIMKHNTFFQKSFSKISKKYFRKFKKVFQKFKKNICIKSKGVFQGPRLFPFSLLILVHTQLTLARSIHDTMIDGHSWISLISFASGGGTHQQKCLARLIHDTRYYGGHFGSDGTIPKFTSIPIPMPIPIKCSISIPILDSDSRFQL